jgi:hypothetical protein
VENPPNLPGLGEVLGAAVETVDDLLRYVKGGSMAGWLVDVQASGNASKELLLATATGLRWFVLCGSKSRSSVNCFMLDVTQPLELEAEVRRTREMGIWRWRMRRSCCFGFEPDGVEWI